MSALTPEQLNAVQAVGKIICVDAGAGSGKTRVLVSRIIHLIERNGIELNQIAAITFTDKAAAELKDRLRRACREKAPLDDPKKMTFWRRMERQVESSRICTIHTFCSGILRENALSLGIDPDFAILTDPESELLRNEIVTATIHGLLEYEDVLAKEAAIEYGPSGLSAILDDLLRQRSLVEQSLRHDRYDSPEAVTAAWQRLRPRIADELLRILARSRRLHSYLRELEKCGGHCEDATEKREQLRTTLCSLLGQLMQERAPVRISLLIAQIAELNARSGKKEKWASEISYDCVKDVLKKLKDYLVKFRPEEPDEATESRAARLTAAVVHVYQKSLAALRAAKRARNALDFDDLIVEAARVLRDTTRGHDSVCARTARGLRHVLIDEFQDTDGVQYEIATSLLSAPERPDLFVVGDAKQSIYYFRGAEVDVFRQARQEAATPLTMLDNFRSTRQVLTFVNSFFSQSNLLASIESPYLPLVPKRVPSGHSAVEFLIPRYEEGVKIEHYREAEAEMIAARLSAIRTEALFVCDATTESPRPARFGDAAILLRSLSNVHIYERALREADIPYTLVAGSGFYERQEVLDLRNLLRIIIDPFDEMALTAFLRSPMVALNDNALIELAGGIGAPRGIRDGFESTLQLSDTSQQTRLARARSIVLLLSESADRPLGEFLHLVLYLTGYEGIVLRQFMGPQRASNLRKVCALADSFSRVQPSRLRAFVRYLDEMAAREVREGEAAANPDDTHAVTLMTVHKAKGLEFPIVFAADLGRTFSKSDSASVAIHKDYGVAVKVLGDNGRLNSPAMHKGITALRADDELAEEARILYVTLTRARDHLFLCGAPPLPNSNSWMAAFDEQYQIYSKKDGATVGGDGWLATVRQTTPQLNSPPVHTQFAEVIDIERIRKHIGPVPTTHPSRSGIAASTIVQSMFGVTDKEERFTLSTPIASLAHGLTARQRGTLIHAFFERWDCRGKPEPVIASLLRAEVVGNDAEQTITSDLLRMTSRLAAHPLGQRIARSRAIQRELPFALRLDEVIIRGTFDLLLDGNTIIDYKTGTPSDVDRAVHATQLQLYAAALHQLTGAGDIKAFLIYLDATADFVETVDVSTTAVESATHRAREVLPEMLFACSVAP